MSLPPVFGAGRRIARWTAACAVLACAPATAFPVKPIRIVVPSTPGGSVDTLARLVGQRLADRFGQQTLIDNRPGAGGAIAGELVARAPADGHTLLMGTVASLASNVSLAKKLPYDPLRDLAPVGLIATQHLVLLVNPSIPARTVKELVALARARPGQLSFASAGTGSGGHLSGELLRNLAGVELLHVPYKGVMPALVDVISGQVAMTFASFLSGLPQARSGKVRALAVTGAHRSGALPELPTMAEAGVSGYESSTWYGLVAPRATPPEPIERLASEIAGMLAAADVRSRIAAEGAEPASGTPAQFGRFIEAEIAKWGRVIRTAGIRPE